jgi:hypothetical protein
MADEPGGRISRPRQIYTGETERPFRRRPDEPSRETVEGKREPALV